MAITTIPENAPDQSEIVLEHMDNPFETYWWTTASITEHSAGFGWVDVG